MYLFLDRFFFIFHSAWILFAVTGWIPRRTRRLNLAALLLTAFSWFGLGLFYGFGYCLCTDWHWQVRRELGDHDLPRSYMKFLADTLLGVDVTAHVVDAITVGGFFAALAASIYLNWCSSRET